MRRRNYSNYIGRHLTLYPLLPSLSRRTQVLQLLDWGQRLHDRAGMPDRDRRLPQVVCM
jgi:hypothetical protein